ncbi:MAG: cytochrome c, partial [Acidobacteriaceae bacterium]|nr:cytochrome c [Acidobacteriaceae bacterium]
MHGRAAHVCIGSMLAAATALGQQSALPDTAGRDTVQRVCGACHPATIVVGRGMSREEWGQVVGNMIGRGARGTPADFAAIIDYLAKNFPEKRAGGTAPRRMGR